VKTVNVPSGFADMDSISVLASGGAVTTGYFEKNATFGPGETNQTTLMAAGNRDGFVARYGSDGTLTWANDIGGTNANVNGSAVTALPDGSSVATGLLIGTATFGAGEPGQTMLTGPGGGAGDMYYLARYAPSGTLSWAKGFSATATGLPTPRAFADTIATVVTDSTFIVGGGFVGALDCGGTTLTNTASQTAYLLARYRPDGSLVWAKQGSVAASNAASSIINVRPFSDGSCVATGEVLGTATFGPGEANQTTIAGPNSNVFFVARFKPDGSLAWVRALDTTSIGYSVCALSDGSAIAVGNFSGIATFGKGEPHETVLTGSAGIFVARYEADGTLAWAKGVTGTGGYQNGQGVDGFADGSSMVVGEYSGQTTFGAGEPGQTVLTASNVNTIFVARYNPDGTLAWVRTVAGNNYTYAHSVAISGSVALVTGLVQPMSTTFGPGEPGQTIVTGTGNTPYIAGYFTTPR
jgi:hypothetical protein